MADPHKRHDPKNARVSNDFATKREVMVAVKNMTREADARIAGIEATLARLTTPWYVKLWRKVST